MNIQDDSGNTP
jgi:hypothetical protein